jgi:alcohol dehydrogenase class IV
MATTPLLTPQPFRWNDAERTIAFGRGSIADAPELIEDGYALLTTPRGLAAAPQLAERAAAVHEVAPGHVDHLAGELLGEVAQDRLVALGGGRVIDVGKSIAAARGEEAGVTVAAIPTTLSAAEMTAIHRQATGASGPPRLVRPALVINDPALSASQPEPELVASALNSLGHAVEGPLTPHATPVVLLVGTEAARLLVGAFGDEVNRDALALGALLAGWCIGESGYGLHHVMSQTLVRFAGVGHGPANAIMLPYTARALAQRFPAAFATFESALGTDVSSAAAALTARTGQTRLRDLGVSAEQLADYADTASERGELALTPPPADRAELLALYEEAW